MRTLILLRHAKSSWDDSDLDDHERPLSKRGTRDAPALGAFIASQRLVPNVVLCSGAVRARATLTLVLSALDRPAPPIEFDDALYLAEPKAMLARLATLAPAIETAMIVGHNPGLHALALSLTGTGERKDLARLAAKFPTCGLAVIDLDATSWAGLEAGRGHLRLFTSPRLLP